MKRFITSMLLISCFSYANGLVSDTTNVDSTYSLRAMLKNGHTVDGKAGVTFSIGFRSPALLNISFWSQDGGEYDFSDIEYISESNGTEKLSTKNVRRMSAIEVIVNNVLGILFYYYIYSLSH